MTTDSKPPLSEWPEFEKGDLIISYPRPGDKLDWNRFWLVVNGHKHNQSFMGNRWFVKISHVLFYSSVEGYKPVVNLTVGERGVVVKGGKIFAYHRNVLTPWVEPGKPKQMGKKTFKVRGHEVEVAWDDFGATDVKISKSGAVVVLGMFGSGGLELSEYSPDGVRVSLSDVLFEEISSEIEDIMAEVKLENEDSDD